MSQYQECSECRGCPASYWHREKCADEMNEQFEKDMMNEMERRHLADLEFDKHVQSMTDREKNNDSQI